MKAFIPALRAFLVLALAASSVAPLRAADPEVPDTLDLPGALDFALKNNFAINQARERIREQEGVQLTVRSTRLPSVDADASYTFNDEEVARTFPRGDRNWGFGVQATQILYAGGSVRASIKSAELAREAAVLELTGIINDQLLLVRTKFLGVLLAQKTIGVQEENIRLLEAQLADAQKLFNAGSTSRFEVLRAEVSLANGKPALISARNGFRIAIEELRQALGFLSKDTPKSAERLAKVPEFVGTLDVSEQESFQLVDAFNSARVNRPELQRIAKLEAAGEQSVTVARAGTRPEVAAIGRYDYVSGADPLGSPSTRWNDRRDGWTAGVQANWKIFDGRATAGRVAQAKSRLVQTKLALEETMLAIEVEVRRAHSAAIEAWELVESTRKVIEQADEALRLANVRFGAGTATQLDVLTSQVSLTDARLNQVRASYSYLVSVAQLKKAMGQPESLATTAK